MKTNTEKPIMINEQLHQKIKEYCQIRGLKISKWCEFELEKSLKESKNAK